MINLSKQNTTVGYCGNVSSCAKLLGSFQLPSLFFSVIAFNLIPWITMIYHIKNPNILAKGPGSFFTFTSFEAPGSTLIFTFCSSFTCGWPWFCTESGVSCGKLSFCTESGVSCGRLSFCTESEVLRVLRGRLSFCAESGVLCGWLSFCTESEVLRVLRGRLSFCAESGVLCGWLSFSTTSGVAFFRRAFRFLGRSSASGTEGSVTFSAASGWARFRWCSVSKTEGSATFSWRSGSKFSSGQLARASSNRWNTSSCNRQGSHQRTQRPSKA